MNVYLRFFIILLMASLLKLGYGSLTESCSKESREADEMCGKYCYKVVKPLLNYAASVRSKEEQFGEQQNKIKDLELTIIKLQHQLNLETTLKKCNDQASTITELLQQRASNDAKFEKLQAKILDQAVTILELETALKKNKDQYSSISLNCLGKSTDVYILNLPNIGTFSAPCDSKLADSGWTVIMRRFDGSVDFNRNWKEFKEGFGDLRGEFFLGLEKLHLLTQFEPHELYIHLKKFDNETAYAKYSHFLIGNEIESYELKMLGDYSGNAGDSMDYHKNMKFSTKDRDNDADNNGSCAQFFQAAGWFKNCGRCNLFGNHTETPENFRLAIYWAGLDYKPMQFVQMMIRPKLH